MRKPVAANKQVNMPMLRRAGPVLGGVGMVEPLKAVADVDRVAIRIMFPLARRPSFENGRKEMFAALGEPRINIDQTPGAASRRQPSLRHGAYLGAHLGAHFGAHLGAHFGAHLAPHFAIA